MSVKELKPLYCSHCTKEISKDDICGRPLGFLNVYELKCSKCGKYSYVPFQDARDA
jgi:hypothetical protein